jgi:hypothetical protein
VHRIATVSVINQLGRMPDGTVRMMVQGVERIRGLRRSVRPLAFLTKPFDAEVLLGAVSVALRPR